MKRVSDYTFDELVGAITDVRVRGVGANMPETLIDGYGNRHPQSTQMWLVLQWSATNIGFGELSFTFGEDGIQCDDEYMGKRFVEAVLVRLARSVDIKSDSVDKVPQDEQAP